MLHSSPEARQCRITVRQVAILASVWMAGTILLLLFRPGYPFPPYELIDSWFYTAYQWDLKELISEFKPLYYTSRLTWILPGALIHSLLPPLAANICFKLIVSATFAFAAASIAYRAAGMTAAVLAVTLSVFAPQIIEALHGDYTDTPVIVYATLALACISLAKNSQKWVAWIFLSGCFFAGMFISNLGALMVPGMGIAAYHLGWLRWSIKKHLLSIGIYLLAIGIVTVAVESIHRALGGKLHFLQPQIMMIFNAYNTDKTPWSPENWQWLYHATWLVLPGAALLWGARQSLPDSSANRLALKFIRSLTVGLFVSLSGALYLEIQSISVLYFPYYASAQLCFALPLLAVLTANHPPRSATSKYVTGATLMLLVTFILVGKPLNTWNSLSSLSGFLPTAESIPLFLAAITLLISLFGSLKFWPTSLRFVSRPEFLLLALVTCSTHSGFLREATSDRLPERYALIYQTYKFLDREFPKQSYKFWVDPKEGNGMSLASTKLWGHRLYTDNPFPEHHHDPITKNTVIIPSSPGQGEATLELATRTLSEAGIRLVNTRIIPIRGHAGLGFDLVCFLTERIPIDPESTPPGMSRAVMLMAYVSEGENSYLNHLGRHSKDASKASVLKQPSGYPLYIPSDPSDHIATAYQVLPHTDTNHRRKLSIVSYFPAEGNCVCVIQNENFEVIARFTLTKKGRAIHTTDLPAYTQQLRVVFECPQATETHLPTHLQFYTFPDP